MKLKLEGIKYDIGSKELLRGIDLNVEKNHFVGLIGPNGCGKTTLLKNIYRYLTPKEGSVYIDDKNIYGMKNKELSKLMAVVMQEHSLEFDFSVKEIVAMGRFSSNNRFASVDGDDEKLIEKALENVGLEEYEDRSFLSLSGGEKQRVMIAMALCQNTELIVLDEPTNHLDIKYQLQIIHMLRHLDITTFTTLHDMNMAATFCDYIYVMKKGKIVTHGPVEKVFTEEMFREVFEVEAHIYRNPYNNKLNVSYLTCCK
ncbi:ABC transporter ATP-binding protein [Clostridium sporogenes]|uniref:ABC transporter ATP-binding protein n=1 Tax=Clostridium botulinum TaxID=1491 RepID=UPI000717988E|nr:ABC transporter ATP-binding protein [Clostridium botulinum]KRU24674.1 ABC transporter ATP-binding protein [Clostridium sporogenes]KRU26419.1 ABC transporter ATP-binding protein [Clostridium sporogenes]KRU35615.1 ABC transporter ATP-binding protein [Clostridium sporogenes]KRU40681.1 ABC transporter ATP-binding protein [Clostridium sporogenes]MBZ1329667.1 ABC transporter ATP-binding protein [Clostridium botulinum]